MAGKQTRRATKNTARGRLEKVVEDVESRSRASTRKGNLTEVIIAPTQDYIAKSTHPGRQPLPEQPDISSILKVNEADQDEENDISYDHPLHSTAIFVNEDNLEDDEERTLNRSKEPETRDRSRVSEASEERNETMTERSEDTSSNQATVKSFQKENTAQTQKGKKRKKSLHSTELDSSEAAGPSSMNVSHPKGVKRSSKSLTDLDVVLTEFEKLASKYKEKVEPDICRGAIEKFCISFREQLTETVTQVEDLKKIKMKNRKMIIAINQKSKRLMEVKDELLKSEPKLKALQKQYAELQERRSNVKNATQFLSDLKTLQEDYLKYIQTNPKEKEVYGAASLPALLLEARGVLGAESHLQTINTKLNNHLKQIGK